MMRLQYMPPSPYARKVLLCAHELGISSQIEYDKVDIWATNATPDNPLGKIPALFSDEGVFFGSGLICEFLAAHVQNATMLAAQGPQRWRTLQLHALADGILEAAIAYKLEYRRPAGLIWPEWGQRQELKLTHTLAALEASALLDLPVRVDLGTIALAAALGYLDIRLPDRAWRTGHPRLNAWFQCFSDRQSYKDSEMSA